MALIEYPELEQRSPEWYDQRRGIVTASAISALVTVGAPDALSVGCPVCHAVADLPCMSMAAKKTPTPIKTIHEARAAIASERPPVYAPANNDTSRGLTALLVAERITGHTDPTFMNDDMWRGVMDEPLAVEVYAKHYAPVKTTGLMVRDDWGFSIGYSPDGLVGDDGLVEVKSRRQKKHLITVLADEVPAENMGQIQCGLLVSGRKWCDYISYSGGMAMWKKRITPDPEWHRAIVAAVAEFELTAERMVDAYLSATEGLPATERIDLELGMIS